MKNTNPTPKFDARFVLMFALNSSHLHIHLFISRLILCFFFVVLAFVSVFFYKLNESGMSGIRSCRYSLQMENHNSHSSQFFFFSVLMFTNSLLKLNGHIIVFPMKSCESVEHQRQPQLFVSMTIDDRGDKRKRI